MNNPFTNNWFCFIAGIVCTICTLLILVNELNLKDKMVETKPDNPKMFEEYKRCLMALNFLSQCMGQLDLEHDAEYWMEYSLQVADKAMTNENLQDKK